MKKEIDIAGVLALVFFIIFVILVVGIPFIMGTPFADKYSSYYAICVWSSVLLGIFFESISVGEG